MSALRRQTAQSDFIDEKISACSALIRRHGPKQKRPPYFTKGVELRYLICGGAGTGFEIVLTYTEKNRIITDDETRC